MSFCHEAAMLERSMGLQYSHRGKTGLRMTGRTCWRWVWLLLSLMSAAGQAAVLQVAVAANFKPALAALAQQWQQRSGDEIRLSSGSTGKLARQILHGAPYDLFFAADSRHVRVLVDRQRVCDPVVYATGSLVLYQREGNAPPLARLKAEDFRHLALANPKTAPYGRAAEETLKKLGLWPQVQSRLVRGENVGQAFQFVETGNAELGFVALSQVRQMERDDPRHVWTVPATWHTPLVQQAAVVCRSPNQAAARAFLQFVLTDPEARALIRQYGYALPEPQP